MFLPSSESQKAGPCVSKQGTGSFCALELSASTLGKAGVPGATSGKTLLADPTSGAEMAN
jgi:hypothetical protein